MTKDNISIATDYAYAIFRKLGDGATVVDIANILNEALDEATKDKDEDILRLVEDMKYIAGIVNRGEQRDLKPDESIRDAIREYVKKLEAEIQELTERLNDIKSAAQIVMDEKCDADERHCTCVPLLRAEIKRLREELSAIKKALEDEK